MFLEELRVLDNYMCILINDVFTNLKRFEKKININIVHNYFIV